jgi:hypothetical protein
LRLASTHLLHRHPQPHIAAMENVKEFAEYVIEDAKDGVADG